MAYRIVLVIATWLAATATFAAEPVLQLATFRVDVTPPIGDGLCVGFMPKIESVEHPLELRGIVLRANGQTFVIAALDYQGLCNSSDDEFRRRMADQRWRVWGGCRSIRSLSRVINSTGV